LIAEAIVNNVRKLIIEDTPVNLRICGNMSDYLSGLVIRWRNDAIEYAEYLERINEMVTQLRVGLR
jgi:type I restriction enzyme R subunit